RRWHPRPSSVAASCCASHPNRFPARDGDRFATRCRPADGDRRVPVAKTVFITGASSGIGRALALELAGRGYDLFLTARRLDALEQLRADIVNAQPSRRVHVRRLDVTDDADVASAIAEAAEELGRCDIVVANAG